MGLVGLLRALWRRRLVVAVGALLAITAAVISIQRGGDVQPTTSSLTRVLIDTPKSLIADAQARGATTIYTRARLVGSLIADDKAKSVIARRAGLQPAELAIMGPGAAAPPDVITPIATQAITVAKPTQPYLISVEVAPNIPIISINANAPDRDRAAKLDRAAVATLPYVAKGTPGGGSIAIERLGSPTVVTKRAAGGHAKPVGGALALFILWCLGCVAFDRLARARGLRQADLTDLRRAWG